MTGDEVKNAPQFQENLASFPGVYGLALQGLGKAVDADQLAAARDRASPDDPPQEALGVWPPPRWSSAPSRALFLGDYKVLAKANQPAFTTAVEAAKNGQHEDRPSSIRR